MQKWEYQVFVRNLKNGDWIWEHDNKDQRGSAQLLNDLGREGWELVAAPSPLAGMWQAGGGQPGHGPAHSILFFIFKRPAQL
jgi:hypothetical protein